MNDSFLETRRTDGAVARVVYVLVSSYNDLPLGVYSSMDLGLAALERFAPTYDRRSMSLYPYEVDWVEEDS